MILIGVGLGATTAPATESIMGSLTTDKAGIGSAVNDTTRELGGTLGVAIIGSVFSSIYVNDLEDNDGVLQQLPPEAQQLTKDSVGAARTVAGQLGANTQPFLDQVNDAFLAGLSAGSLVAAGVAAAGAILRQPLPPSPGHTMTTPPTRRATPPQPAPARDYRHRATDHGGTPTRAPERHTDLSLRRHTLHHDRSRLQTCKETYEPRSVDHCRTASRSHVERRHQTVRAQGEAGHQVRQGMDGRQQRRLVNFIGALELAAVGLILPAALGIAPVLVPLAAVGVVVLMVGAMITHLHRNEVVPIVMNVIFFAMAAFVTWGRFAPALLQPVRCLLDTGPDHRGSNLGEATLVDSAVIDRHCTAPRAARHG